MLSLTCTSLFTVRANYLDDLPENPPNLRRTLASGSPLWGSWGTPASVWPLGEPEPPDFDDAVSEELAEVSTEPPAK